jgi:hypothetical protein
MSVGGAFSISFKLLDVGRERLGVRKRLEEAISGRHLPTHQIRANSLGHAMREQTLDDTRSTSAIIAKNHASKVCFGEVHTERRRRIFPV